MPLFLPSRIRRAVIAAATFVSYVLVCALGPAGVARGQSFVIVSSDFNDSVQMYDLSGNHVRAFVPGGGGGLDSPQGICVGPDGNVYVSSAANDRVLRYNGLTGAPMGQFQTGGGLDQPWYLRFGPDGDLYVSSSLTSQVLCYDGTSGAFKRVAAQGGGLARPDGLSFDADGNLLVSDFALVTSRVRKYNPQTGQWLGDVVVDPNLRGPLENRLSADGSTLFVSSFGTSEVRKYSMPGGAYLGNFASAPLNGSVGQVVMPNGAEVLVSSWNNSAIYRFGADSGAFLGTFTSGGPLNHPNNLAILTVPEPGSIGAAATGVLMLIARARAAMSRRC